MQVFADEEKKAHGGKRARSGRKPGRKRALANFTLSHQTIALLHKVVPGRGRSAFVETAILKACAGLIPAERN